MRVGYWEFEDREGKPMVHASMWLNGEEYQWASMKTTPDSLPYVETALLAMARAIRERR